MRLAHFLANAASRARDNGDLASRPRRRSVPRVESLDDRCLLSLPPTGIGHMHSGVVGFRPAAFPIQWSYIPNIVNVTSDPSHTLIMHFSQGTDMSDHVSGALVPC
jgi:hypothetical protein